MLSKLLIPGSVLFSVILVHVAYVDFRFRHRGSVPWFWRAVPPPPLLWVSRAAAAAAVVAALSTAVLGATKLIAVVLVGLMLIHIGALVVLERGDNR